MSIQGTSQCGLVVHFPLPLPIVTFLWICSFYLCLRKWRKNWRDGSVIKSTSSSSRGQEFSSQHLHNGSHPSITNIWCPLWHKGIYADREDSYKLHNGIFKKKNKRGKEINHTEYPNCFRPLTLCLSRKGLPGNSDYTLTLRMTVRTANASVWKEDSKAASVVGGVRERPLWSWDRIEDYWHACSITSTYLMCKFFK